MRQTDLKLAPNLGKPENVYQDNMKAAMAANETSKTNGRAEARSKTNKQTIQLEFCNSTRRQLDRRTKNGDSGRNIGSSANGE
jgi:hypothetical protein